MFYILQYGAFKANVFKTDPMIVTSAVAQLVRTSPRKRKVGCSNPSRSRSKSHKQVETATLPNARQQMSLIRVFGHNHFKQMPRITPITVCVAR